MKIICETTAEADLLARRLPAIQRLLGLQPTTNLQGHRLEQLLAVELAAADLERCLMLVAPND
ncbi:MULTISPECIES: hypothetical protein [unclassified Synechococcus]|uniref:hypothetical protein n=1 Tax=unclassified Synechococcus TaxID=2626047 RepID=UPI001C24CC4E|nr:MULTISPECIES: hypothetical protein [unclassified Synechococcus]